MWFERKKQSGNAWKTHPRCAEIWPDSLPVHPAADGICAAQLQGSMSAGQGKHPLWNLPTGSHIAYALVPAIPFQWNIQHCISIRYAIF